jgi:Fe-S cluster assembly protein SufD
VTTTYLEDFATFAANGGTRAPWLQGLRQAGIERFQADGFPSARDEDWRFTNIAAVVSTPFRPAPADVSGVSAAGLAPFLYAIPGVRTLVFVNGRFAPGLSSVSELPAGVVVRNLAGAIGPESELLDAHLGKYARPEASGFTALNTAFVRDGLFLRVSRDVDAGAPIHVVFAADSRAEGSAAYPRNFIYLERGARAAVLESYVGLHDGVYFTNAVTEAVVGEGAYLEHTKIQRESEQAYHVGTAHFHQARSSRVHSHSVAFGGALGRNTLDMVLDGPGIESQLLGLYMGHGRQELDNHTSILHAHPDCATREVYKGILDGRSHGVFNGKIYVTPIAQKTDAKQTNRVLLLSDTARIDTKPQLEIFADDVKCTHGATVGALDPMSRFYLQSRGIGGTLATRILTYAFAAEVLEGLPYASVRTALEEVVMRRLSEREAA